MIMVAEKIHEMRLLLSPKDLKWFKENFPMFDWIAGDTKIRWNANNPEEVEMARQAFEAYKKKHKKAMAFKVNPDDKKDTKALNGFDPNAEYIIMQEFMHKG